VDLWAAGGIALRRYVLHVLRQLRLQLHARVASTTDKEACHGMLATGIKGARYREGLVKCVTPFLAPKPVPR